jgi:hypothetical protein
MQNKAFSSARSASSGATSSRGSSRSPIGKWWDCRRYRHISVDLLYAEDTERQLAELTDITHIFYAGFQATPGNASSFASNTGPNRDMLVNSAPPQLAPHLV